MLEYIFKAVPDKTLADISGDSCKLFRAVVFVLQIMLYGILLELCPLDKVNYGAVDLPFPITI